MSANHSTDEEEKNAHWNIRKDRSTIPSKPYLSLIREDGTEIKNFYDFVPISLQGTGIEVDFLKARIEYLENYIKWFGLHKVRFEKKEEEEDGEEEISETNTNRTSFIRHSPFHQNSSDMSEVVVEETEEKLAEVYQDNEIVAGFITEEFLEQNDERNDSNEGDVSSNNSPEQSNNDKPESTEEEKVKAKKVDLILERLNILEILPETLFQKEKDWEDSEYISDVLKNSFEFKDLSISSYIASGSYGHCFSFRYHLKVKANGRMVIPRLFVGKFLKNQFGPDPKFLISKDSPDIDYHKNLSSIIYKDWKMEVDQNKLLECYNRGKDVKREKLFLEKGIIVMKHYTWDLDLYLKLRRYKNIPLSLLEICYLIKGILEGSQNLNQNRICHRDIRPNNIFLEINDKYSRVIIGDFGQSIDFDKRKGKLKGIMKIKSTDLDCKEVLSAVYGSDYVDAGNSTIMAPENKKYDIENEEIWELNYENSDMYSIGLIGKLLLLEHYEEEDNEKEEEQKDLFNNLINKMNEENPVKRVKYRESLKRINNIIKILYKSPEIEEEEEIIYSEEKSKKLFSLVKFRDIKKIETLLLEKDVDVNWKSNYVMYFIYLPRECSISNLLIPKN